MPTPKRELRKLRSRPRERRKVRQLEEEAVDALSVQSTSLRDQAWSRQRRAVAKSLGILGEIWNGFVQPGSEDVI